MAKTPSPLHIKRIPKSVSAPTPSVDAAVAESAVTPPAKKARPAPKKALVGVKEAKAAAPVVVTEPSAKSARTNKLKLVRDSFTMPKDEYQAIDALKGRALGLEKHVRKSELLRAGIRALSAMNDRAFLKAISAVPTLKTGRPKAD